MSVVHIPVKYIQPIESLLVNLEDGTSVHWFNSRLVQQEPLDIVIEWVDGKPYKVSTI